MLTCMYACLYVSGRLLAWIICSLASILLALSIAYCSLMAALLWFHMDLYFTILTDIPMHGYNNKACCLNEECVHACMRAWLRSECCVRTATADTEGGAE